jgi:hypothetical protein
MKREKVSWVSSDESEPNYGRDSNIALWCFDGLWNAEKQRYRKRDVGREHLEHNVSIIALDAARERVAVIVIRQMRAEPYADLK